jgi:hypothetical protein
VRRLFEQKIRVVAPIAHFTTLKGNGRTFVNLREKNDAFLAPMGQAKRSTLRVRLFLPEFFLLLKERNYCNLLYIFFNVRQKKCQYFHSFAFIKYVIFESVKKR